jgi:maleamate amidohydrolase
VVLVIDVNYNFVGDRREPIQESVQRWRTSCGEDGWQAVDHIQKLPAAARHRRIPILYSTGIQPRPDGWEAGHWADKNSRRREDIRRGSEDEGNARLARRSHIKARTRGFQGAEPFA